MAHITSQSQCSVESNTVSSETTLVEEKSDSAKEGTYSEHSVNNSLSPSSTYLFPSEENSGFTTEAVHSSCHSLEDISCSVRKKNMDKSRKGTKGIRDSRSEGRAIKGGASLDSASMGVAGQEEGCATLNLATNMERVNPDFATFERSGSPYPSSENDWEASDHSDTDTDHSDSSDDDNPTSQVDRLIERGVRLIMDGENSNLSSETDDTDDEEDFDDDSDSDITDVSPLVSTTASPLGLSPVMSRRNLPSSISVRPPFFRHYSHHGHDGDVEDEEDEEELNKFSDIYNHHDNSKESDSTNMSLLMKAVIELDKVNNARTMVNEDNNKNINCHYSDTNSLPRVFHNKHTDISNAIHNAHHKHTRKISHSRRKNMSFTNEEVRIIDRDNSRLLEKILAVHHRPNERPHSNSNSNYLLPAQKPANATINRRRQAETIEKDNLSLLRRLQEVKPSRAVVGSKNGRPLHPPNRHHHHHHHHHHYHHHQQHHQQFVPTADTTRSCSATAARHSPFSPPHHHTPKETAL